jgi:peptidoglycan/xylan/chitin deacetylase (PgdA/CDA1 family)
VRPTDFRRQLETILAAGLEVVRLAEAIPALSQADDARRVAITFDDSYGDFPDHALPVLRELELPATIFVPTALVGEKLDWYPDSPRALTWDELEALATEGLVDLQSHSRTHPWLPRVDDRQARDEISGSKHELEARLSSEVTSFCYPAGLYGDRELRLVREAGYRGAVGTDPGVNRSDAPVYALKRTLIFWGDSSRVFAAKLAGLLDRPSWGRALVQRHRAGRRR